ncbi:MAG: pilin [Deltaproteobacteria bacterium]|nr:pilin [Deltaproteobacteria bacterium]
MRSQRGFTLIELLTVVAIIGVLGAIALTNFHIYRHKAAYSVLQSTVSNVQLAAEGALSHPDHLPAAVPLTSQSTSGAISNALAAAFLPGMMLPKNVKFQVSYDPACITAACVSGWAQLNHCAGKEYLQWLKYGDGTDLVLENIPGAGCT